MKLPPGKVGSAGQEAIDLAAKAGLFLDDWQRWVLLEACGERVDGKWAATECALVLPRQNGKNAVLEALELAAVFLWDMELVVHSAHRFDTSQEHYFRLKALIEGCDDLMAKMPASGNRGFTAANGKEQIALANGNRIKFKARGGGSARGFSGNMIVFDEAYDLPDRVMGDVVPTLSAKTMGVGPGVQIWYTSSAPHADSDQLHRIVARGRSDLVERLFYAEWGNPKGTDPEDREAWARANPALNIRIAESFIEETELHALPPEEFARERLGVADEVGVISPISADDWNACSTDVTFVPEVFAVHVRRDRKRAWIVAAGPQDDGLLQVEVLPSVPMASVDAGVGELDLKARLLALIEAKKPRRVAFNATNCGDLLEELEKAGHSLVKDGGILAPVDAAESGQGCATLFDAVLARKLRHRGQSELNEAVFGAVQRDWNNGWTWDWRKSEGDVSPLVAATFAYFGCVQLRAPKVRKPRSFNLGEMIAKLDDQE